MLKIGHIFDSVLKMSKVSNILLWYVEIPSKTLKHGFIRIRYKCNLNTFGLRKKWNEKLITFVVDYAYLCLLLVIWDFYLQKALALHVIYFLR